MTRRSVITAVLFALAGALFAMLVIGLPTDVVPNPWFTRMTPVRPQDDAFLGLAVVLSGLLAASYALPQTRACATQERKTVAGGALSFLAVGCPICNKLIVAVLGISGTLSYFAPIQPILGALSVGLLAVAVWLRWRPVVAARSMTAAGALTERS